MLICIYPITETIFSIYRKYKRIGHDPSKPDGIHLHMLIYRNLSRRISQTFKIKDYRNSITSIIMWFYPLFSCIVAIFTFDKYYLNFIMVMIFILLYLLTYRKVSLNWKKPEK